MPYMLSKNIVFICDTVFSHEDATLSSKDLEKPIQTYYNDVLAALHEISRNVICYQSPNEFLNTIQKHKNDLVLSLWSGENSRNRRALVPSICEAYHLPYVGADSFIQSICADKHVCKSLCFPYGIKTANDVCIQRDFELKKLHYLTYPIVVKPNYEGGSIGIFQNSLADDCSQAKDITRNLLKYFPSVIAEEYIKGYEVSICIAGLAGAVDLFQVVKISLNGNDYFEHEIFSAEAKKMGQASRVRTIVDNLLTEEEKSKIINFYNSLGKVEAIRVDGRINEHGFCLIELTPDCSLSKTSSMYMAFQAAGYSYTQMFELLCRNALASYSSTSGIGKCQ